MNIYQEAYKNVTNGLLLSGFNWCIIYSKIYVEGGFMSGFNLKYKRKINNFFDKMDNCLNKKVVKPIPGTNNFSNLGNKYMIKLNVPGYLKKDINVKLKNSILYISGYQEIKSKVKSGDKTFLRKSKTKSFRKIYRLPVDINQKKKNVSLRSGILTVTLFRKKSS